MLAPTMGRGIRDQCEHHIRQDCTRETACDLDSDVERTLTHMHLAPRGGDECHRGVELCTGNRPEHLDQHTEGKDRRHHVHEQHDCEVLGQERAHDSGTNDCRHEQRCAEVLGSEAAWHEGKVNQMCATRSSQSGQTRDERP